MRESPYRHARERRAVGDADAAAWARLIRQRWSRRAVALVACAASCAQVVRELDLFHWLRAEGLGDYTPVAAFVPLFALVLLFVRADARRASCPSCATPFFAGPIAEVLFARRCASCGAAAPRA